MSSSRIQAENIQHNHSNDQSFRINTGAADAERLFLPQAVDNNGKARSTTPPSAPQRKTTKAFYPQAVDNNTLGKTNPLYENKPLTDAPVERRYLSRQSQLDALNHEISPVQPKKGFFSVFKSK